MEPAGSKQSKVCPVSALDIAEIQTIAHLEVMGSRTLHVLTSMTGRGTLNGLDNLTLKNVHWFLRMIWAGKAESRLFAAVRESQ